MGIAHRGINLLLNHTGLEKSISELKGTWQVGGNWETSIAGVGEEEGEKS